MLDFDTMANLYRIEPVIADILRRKLIYKQIRKYAKTKQDLGRKQWWWRGIEIAIAKHSNPVGRMVEASRQMHIKLRELELYLTRLKK